MEEASLEQMEQVETATITHLLAMMTTMINVRRIKKI